MRDNTIFDDVFRTMMEKMTFLVVPLINDVFHTSYPADVEIVQLRNEYQRVDGEIITDSRLLIGNRIYHIECQSTDDTTMAVRMIVCQKAGTEVSDGVSTFLCVVSEK